MTRKKEEKLEENFRPVLSPSLPLLILTANKSRKFSKWFKTSPSISTDDIFGVSKWNDFCGFLDSSHFIWASWASTTCNLTKFDLSTNFYQPQKNLIIDNYQALSKNQKTSFSIFLEERKFNFSQIPWSTKTHRWVHKIIFYFEQYMGNGKLFAVFVVIIHQFQLPLMCELNDSKVTHAGCMNIAKYFF